jgi:hypothetical protein
VLTIGFVVGFTFATPAHADPADLSFVQFLGTNATPIPQEQISACDPNYSGACVPIASDVDCASGSGNGPAYVSGSVTVVEMTSTNLIETATELGANRPADALLAVAVWPELDRAADTLLSGDADQRQLVQLDNARNTP